MLIGNAKAEYDLDEASDPTKPHFFAPLKLLCINYFVSAASCEQYILSRLSLKSKGFTHFKAFSIDKLTAMIPQWQRQLDLAIEGLILQQVITSEPMFLRVGVARIQEHNGVYEDLEKTI